MLKLASLLRECADAFMNPFVAENLCSSQSRRIEYDMVNLLLIESAVRTLEYICIDVRCKYLKGISLVLFINR
jgi:hypothetical protein